MQLTSNILQALPVLDFPFERLPDFYVPQSTCVRLEDGSRRLLFKVCYLDRPNRACIGIYNNLSTARVTALPRALASLSTYCRVRGLRPASCNSILQSFILFLNWADKPEHCGKYEEVLSEPNLALEAIERYNAEHKLDVQAGRKNQNTSAEQVGSVRTILSKIHNRNYSDEVEIISTSAQSKVHTVAPARSVIQSIVSDLANIFDLCAEIILRPNSPKALCRAVRLGQGDAEKEYKLQSDIDDFVVMDIACLSFATLAIADSGANLAQVQNLEFSENLEGQIENPEIVTLRTKEVKFRAGGKEVPVHFTTVTRRRFKTYLQIRQLLINEFPDTNVDDLIFVCLQYARGGHYPTPINLVDIRNLLVAIRARVTRLEGYTLPRVTLRQLRLSAGNKFCEIAGPVVAAARLGHTLKTAIENYNRASPEERNEELSTFFNSVAKSAVEAARNGAPAPGEEELSTGVCKRRGSPEKILIVPENVNPDCKSAEGCLFCEHYRIHADETDIRKLLSCWFVMCRIANTRGSAVEVVEIYRAIMARIQSLLSELQQRCPDVYAKIEHDVQVNRKLSTYWATRYQQLSLLGLVSGSESLLDARQP